jgi:maltose alpha-D-glucosyltransferase/alpha-amylase
MHRALASATDDPAFAPEPTTDRDRDATIAATHAGKERLLRTLRDRPELVPAETRPLVDRLLARAPVLDSILKEAASLRVATKRTRIHGDYHLGQVLVTPEDDFVIIDFEGEPARSLDERRAKRSPLTDVAGMLRSYHYAAYQGLETHAATGSVPRGQAAAAASWARFWYGWVAGAFLRAYLSASGDAPFIPRDRGELEDLLVVHVLEKAVYELGYELNNRPDWVGLPLQGIAALVPEEA